MKTDTITLTDLFDKPKRYLIPLFQRGYVWKQGDQWEPLWEDISTQANEVLVKSVHLGSSKGHFLGAVVLNQMTTMIRQVPVSEVIDGQQRLTTLQVILIALRDVTREMENEYLSQTLTRLTENPKPFTTETELYKVWPTNAYREDFTLVASIGSAEALRDRYPQRRRYGKLWPEHPPLIGAYLYFADCIRSFIEHAPEYDEEETAYSHLERAEALIEALTTRLRLVSIELDASDDPQVIFETLNARGAPLEPSDLVRNLVFLQASRRNENVDLLYEKHWGHFDTDFWKQRERQGRLQRSRLDLYLFHYITLKSVHEVAIGHLYQAFKEWWQESGRISSPTEVGLQEITDVSNTFRALWWPEGVGRIQAFARRLRVLDTTTVYPLLLWMFQHRADVSPEEFELSLRHIESYVIRRMVCGLTIKNYNRIFLALLGKLNELGKLSQQGVANELLQLSGDSGLWPDDDRFAWSIISAPLYLQIGARRVQMLLAALEEGSRDSKTENIPLPSTLTVEHVMPQSYHPEEWPFPGQFHEDETRRKQIRLIHIHSLGNLTLLTSPLNASISNSSFLKKRPDITSNSILKMNTYFQGREAWDEVGIAGRGKDLASEALKLWPCPQAS